LLLSLRKNGWRRDSRLHLISTHCLSYCIDGKLLANTTQSFSTASGTTPIPACRRIGSAEAAPQGRACSGTHDGANFFSEQHTVRPRKRVLNGLLCAQLLHHFPILDVHLLADPVDVFDAEATGLCGHEFASAHLAGLRHLVAKAKEIKAKLMLAICKGAEVGFAPATAVGTIMVVNGKACIYGDGASSLVQASGKVEWIKTEVSSPGDTGKWAEGYKVTVSLKRKDQTEAYVRSFSFEDAKRARLTGKQGPWTDYPERQCYWRAWSWCARDGASDALMGLAVAEEVRDYEIEAQRGRKTETSDLDVAPIPPTSEEHASA